VTEAVGSDVPEGPRLTVDLLHVHYGTDLQAIHQSQRQTVREAFAVKRGGGGNLGQIGDGVQLLSVLGEQYGGSVTSYKDTDGAAVEEAVKGHGMRSYGDLPAIGQRGQASRGVRFQGVEVHGPVPHAHQEYGAGDAGEVHQEYVSDLCRLICVL